MQSSKLQRGIQTLNLKLQLLIFHFELLTEFSIPYSPNIFQPDLKRDNLTSYGLYGMVQLFLLKGRLILFLTFSILSFPRT